MATTTLTNFTNFAEMLEHLRDTLVAAAGVEGADDIGAFFSIRKAGYSTSGEFSSLSEWLDDIADALQDFVVEERDEIESWDA